MNAVDINKTMTVDFLVSMILVIIIECVDVLRIVLLSIFNKIGNFVQFYQQQELLLHADLAQENQTTNIDIDKIGFLLKTLTTMMIT